MLLTAQEFMDTFEDRRKAAVEASKLTHNAICKCPDCLTERLGEHFEKHPYQMPRKVRGQTTR